MKNFIAMDIYATIARQLRLKRLQAGLTIEDLADAAEISVSFLAYLETNKKKPSLATIAKIAAALNVPVSELLNEKTVPDIAGEEQKTLNRILKLLQNQSPENTDTILATIKVLAQKLLKKRT
jgi:transcriptional regulator with XRE-family HTH domain